MKNKEYFQELTNTANELRSTDIEKEIAKIENFMEAEAKKGLNIARYTFEDPQSTLIHTVCEKIAKDTGIIVTDVSNFLPGQINLQW